MKRFMRFGLGTAVVAVLCSLSVVTPASASTARSVNCASGSEIGTKVPVISVHGLTAGPKVWEPMIPALRSITNAYVVEPFDYESSSAQWVTNPNIGPKLAETIDCLAQASQEGGGKGEVIAVGHSMGGLAIEYASNQVVNGRKVSDELASVITIAAPFQGSILGNAGSMLLNSLCQATFQVGRLVQEYVNHENCLASLAVHGLAIGSTELKALLPFPAGLPVKVIAGNVTPEIKLGFVTITGPPEDGDLVVGVGSATPPDRYTDQGKGDGKKIVECKGVIMEPIISDAPCSHSKLLTDEDVQNEVKQSIQAYIASTKAPSIPMTHSLQIGSMEVPIPNTWDTGMSGVSYLNLVDHTTCEGSDADCPHTYIYDLSSSEPGSQVGAHTGDPVSEFAVKQCNATNGPAYQPPKFAGTTYIGGVKADRYEQQVCAPDVSRSKLFIWWIKERNFMVVNYNLLNDAPSYGLPEMLSRVTWH